MRAIILAAGRGSRMGECTATIPKCLTNLHGKTLLDHQLRAIKQRGITNIALVTGYKSETLESVPYIKFHNRNWNNSSSLSSLMCASQWLNEDTCLVSYSDIFYSSSAVESLIDCDADIAITYDTQWQDLWSQRFEDPLADAESFKLGCQQNLLEIGKKATSVDEIGGQFMGLLKFSPKGWKRLSNIINDLPQPEINKLDMTATLQALIESNYNAIKAIPHDGVWGEVDSLKDLNIYESWKTLS